MGWNKDRAVYNERFAAYNQNLLRSHSLAVDPLSSEEEVRGMMLVRLNMALYGCTGLSMDVINMYKEFLNRKIHPIVPSRGSVGEADLAVNAMIGMSMIGENDVVFKGEIRDSAEVIKEENLPKIVLGPKDGLGIVSSNTQCFARAAMLIKEVKDLIKINNVIYSLGLEGLNGQLQQLHEGVANAKGFNEQNICSKECMELLSGSFLFDDDKGKALQDPLSFRGTTIINGAALEAVHLLEKNLLSQLNHSDDNPCILVDEDLVLVSSNYEPIDVVLKVEMLNIALSHISKNSCHRTLKLADPSFTGLERFLSPDGGKTVIGYSTIQKTFASLDAENRSLSNPSSADYMALSGYIEDHSTNSVVVLDKSFKLVDNIRYILGIELMHAAQAVDLRKNYKLGKGTKVAFDMTREIIPFLSEDRKLSVDIKNAYEIIKSNKFLKAFEV